MKAQMYFDDAKRPAWKTVEIKPGQQIEEAISSAAEAEGGAQDMDTVQVVFEHGGEL